MPTIVYYLINGASVEGRILFLLEKIDDLRALSTLKHIVERLKASAHQI